jgi:hypothetical protein
MHSLSYCGFIRLNEPAKIREERVQANITGLRDTLHNAVKDSVRLEQMSKRIQSVGEQFHSRLIKARMAIAQLATEDECKEITSLDQRFRMHELMNAEEWRNVYAAVNQQD